jgi:homoisocitrate dehydrogenase
MQAMAFRMPARRMATVARSSLKIGLIPADGIGREVIPVRRLAMSFVRLC